MELIHLILRSLLLGIAIIQGFSFIRLALVFYLSLCNLCLLVSCHRFRCCIR